MLRDIFIPDGLEQEALTAAGEGTRELIRFRCGEKKFDMWRGLFDNFLQGIEGGIAQHVNFVDEVNLEAAAKRRRSYFIPDFSYLLRAVVAGSIDFEKVIVGAGGRARAGLAMLAGFRGWTSFAVQGFSNIRAREVLPIPRGPVKR
jgi:hypothetical protein